MSIENILSIDTTGDLCSVALQVGVKQYEFHEIRPREHARILLPEVHKLLQEAGIRGADLQLVIYGRGPGSFTGVRIAASVAQGLTFAADCQALPISSLQSMAYSAKAEVGTVVNVALDARMAELYFGSFMISNSGLPRLTREEAVLKPSAIKVERSSVLVGNGWQTDYGFSAELKEAAGTARAPSLPDARENLALGHLLIADNPALMVPPEQALPIYLRDQVTWDRKAAEVAQAR